MRTLTGFVGIADNSPDPNAPFRFSVLDVNGHLLGSAQTVDYGQQAEISVPVAGVVRIRLQVENLGGDLSDWVYPAFADMMFNP
jgi:hypothetical protein